jgi:hypothetical protein
MCLVINPLCYVPNPVTSIANDALDAMAKTLGQGFGDMVTTITTFWTRLDVPTLAGGPIATLQSDLYWLQGFIVVATLIFAAAVPEKAATAKKQIMYSLLGLVAVMAAFLITSLIRSVVTKAFT